MSPFRRERIVAVAPTFPDKPIRPVDHEVGTLIAGYVATSCDGFALGFKRPRDAVRTSLADCPFPVSQDDMLSAFWHFSILKTAATGKIVEVPLRF